jgi:hypothetical protein
MPKLDGTGPEGKKSQTGRKLGNCSEISDKEKLEKLGKGEGKKRQSGGGKGKGRRLKYNNKTD